MAGPGKKPAEPGDPDWVPLQYIQRGPGSKHRGYEGAAYDSRLTLRGPENAELTLILRIFFQRVDPTLEGGGKSVVTTRGRSAGEFRLAEITDQEWNRFRSMACYHANN